MSKRRTKRSKPNTSLKIDQMLCSPQPRANEAKGDHANVNGTQANTPSQTSVSIETLAKEAAGGDGAMSADNEAHHGDYASLAGEIRAMYREHNVNLQKVGADVSSIKDIMDSLKTDVASLGNRIGEAEERISKLEDDHTSLADKTTNLNGRVSQLEARVQYMENYSRRNNLRIRGIPENTERAGKMTECVMDLLSCLFSNAEEAKDIVIERAHRVPTARPRDLQERTGPRHILVRFLRYSDREKVRLRARELGAFHWNESKVDFFPDFTKEVQDKRSKFTEVRRLCMGKGLRYTLQYPAVFWVTLDGRRQRFEDPAAAKRSINNYQPTEIQGD